MTVIVRDLSALELLPRALAIGTFDGVHIGHREVIAATVRAAREQGLTATALTFDHHPLSIVSPVDEPRVLTPFALKAELIARYLCRVLNHMAARGSDVCVPVSDEQVPATGLAIDLSSGYIQRAAAVLPRQTGHKPWRMNQEYLEDLWALRFTRLDDGALRLYRHGEFHATPHRAGNP